MKRRFVRAVLAALAAAGVWSAAAPAQAQEVQLTGPLKGAPAVRNMRLYRQGRFEIDPTISFSLLDEYRRTILIGARLNYNITDWLGIGVWGAFGAINSTTDLTDRIDAVSPRDPLTAINVNHSAGPSGCKAAPNSTSQCPDAPFANQTAKMDWVVAPQLTFVPFRGKLAIFNKIFVDTDFYVTAGIGIVGVQERANCGGGGSEPACSDPTSFTLQSTTKVSYGTFGVGLTFYPGDFWSLGVEYRALPFAWNLSGFDSSGGGPSKQFPDTKVNGDDETFHFNQLVTITVGFSFPTKPKITE
jgi:outer membrane beta-barrel protein